MDTMEWGLFWLTLTAMGGALIPWHEHTTKMKRDSAAITNTGRIPRYDGVQELRPSDQVIYSWYHSRSSQTAAHGFPDELRDIPIYFIIPPSEPFAVVGSPKAVPFDANVMSREAAAVGLDWDGFRMWRVAKKRDEYGLLSNQTGIRCTNVWRDGGTVHAELSPCSFLDYMCTELAVNLDAPGQLPNMRRLFEGPLWDLEDAKMNLADVRSAALRYSLLASICCLLTTADGFLVLQRRSKHVSEGAGYLAASATGFAEWPSDVGILKRALMLRTKAWKFSHVLKHAALRELREELGVEQKFIVPEQRDFLGAAFNLLHGRDLNFYVHFQTVLTHRQISERRARARDRWEVAHLVFIDLRSIRAVDGMLMGSYAGLKSQCNRHLRAALYAFAKSGKLEQSKRAAGVL